MIHVCNAILAVIRDVLGGPAGEKSEEGQLDIEDIFRKFRIAIAKLKTTIHGFSKPNMFLLSTRICPPVLTWNSPRTGIYARFPSFHIAEYFNSVQLATLVRINPIFSALEFRMAKLQVSAVPSRVFTGPIRTNEAF